MANRVTSEYLKKSRRSIPHHGKTSLGTKVFASGTVYCGERKVEMREIASENAVLPENMNQPTNATVENSRNWILTVLYFMI